MNTTVEWPETTVYLECHEYINDTWRTDLVSKIPFLVVVQIVPDCSVDWFVFPEYTSEPAIFDERAAPSVPTKVG